METSDTSSDAFERHNEAVDVYLVGDYEGAADRFKALYEQTQNPTVARMALYGLACARLMAAETPMAYQEALDLWDAWMNTDPCPGVYENARLLAPIVRHKMLFSQMPHDLEGMTKEGQAVPKWFMVQVDQELRRIKAQSDAAGPQIEDRDKRIKSLEQEINRLNQQIEAFEEIDQKIHQRKSAIPSSE